MLPAARHEPWKAATCSSWEISAWEPVPGQVRPASTAIEMSPTARKDSPSRTTRDLPPEPVCGCARLESATGCELRPAVHQHHHPPQPPTLAHCVAVRAQQRARRAARARAACHDVPGITPPVPGHATVLEPAAGDHVAAVREAYAPGTLRTASYLPDRCRVRTAGQFHRRQPTWNANAPCMKNR